MKKIILFPMLVLFTFQLTTAQKISLTYKVKTDDSLYVFKDNAFSDKYIQTKFGKVFSRISPTNNIIYIEDNINRRFDKIIFKNVTYRSKLLAEGHYDLYEQEINNKSCYFIYSENDTLILEKNDSVVENTYRVDRKYNGKLVLLCKDYPDLWEKARNVKFRNEDLQALVSELNDKYSGNSITQKEKNRFDYLGLSFKGIVRNNNTDIMLDILMSRYFLNISPNFSFRYGLRAFYVQQKIYYPKLQSDTHITDSEGVAIMTLIRKGFNETISAELFEIPLSVNFEITNSKLTPYFYGGISPLLSFVKITREGTSKTRNYSVFRLNAFAAAGMKLKLTNKFNILSEFSVNAVIGLNMKLGVEYFMKL